MPCANVMDSYNLRLLVLGKKENLEPLQILLFQFVIRVRKRTRLWKIFFVSDFTQSLCHQWDKNYVIWIYLKILILDNAPGHPTDLVSENNQIAVMYIPPHVHH